MECIQSISFVMASEYSLTLNNLPVRDASLTGLLPPPSPGLSSTGKGMSPLASKVTAILSTSYSDTEFRNALELLDQRAISNDATSRRQIRLKLQKEVIDSNGEIIDEFGRVAEVNPQILRRGFH